MGEVALSNSQLQRTRNLILHRAERHTTEYSVMIWSRPGIWDWSSDSILPSSRGLASRRDSGNFDVKSLWSSRIDVRIVNSGGFLDVCYR